MTPALGLLVLGCLAVSFTAGVLLGRTIASQRQVDRRLRRELRFREPSVSPTEVPEHMLDISALLPPIYVPAGLTPGDSTQEVMARIEASSVELSRQRARSLDDETQRLVDRAREGGRCGIPVRVPTGLVPCLGEPGHPGVCG